VLFSSQADKPPKAGRSREKRRGTGRKEGTNRGKKKSFPESAPSEVIKTVWLCGTAGNAKSWLGKGKTEQAKAEVRKTKVENQ